MTQTFGLVAALAWPLPMVVAAFLVARDRTLKFRIVWALMCFVGVGAFWMQQGTGHWGFIPLAINVLGPCVLRCTLSLGLMLAGVARWVPGLETEIPARARSPVSFSEQSHGRSAWRSSSNTGAEL